ncbi:hypothetical protein SAMN02745229_01202 [Butyrivibrio fibrisolvens DSM 3071]|uniref:Uncharacterized protein n=1 Tax=Butyrivibrio fibrisolvens DSM 3071 TaxID=1121131 RepID=A0A1M5X0C3_BUTFI|nr:hypothetical protein [Butyrivibrio fibrisolvens]SHH92978.1 hypothetical protein SAMN02745229_01202 [Butyrivibrio fibrisolvens DSM 3071]
MAKGRLKDLISAVSENGVKDLLESDAAKTVAVELGKHIVEEETALVIGSVFAAIAPRLNGIRITYKEKRFERNVAEAISIVNKKIDEIDNKINALSEVMQDKFSGKYIEWILDNLYEEKQTEKVPYHVQGFINMMNMDTTDDIMMIFLETLNQLTVLDIDVLKMYSHEYEENWQNVLEKRGISYEQMDMIKAKLERLGLLYSNNDDQRDTNTDLIADYLEKRVKEENKRNGNPSKIKLGKIKKVSRSESYSITKLGREFLRNIE